MILSKSDYMLFLRHPAWLWLKKFEKFKLPPIDANLQTMFDAGHEFEKYAEKLFFDGVELGFNNYQEYLSLPIRTEKVLNDGARVIFQGRFEIEGITAIVDVLEKVEENIFDLIEIKSSTKAKPEHEYDLAFQTVLLEKTGIKIRNSFVVHVNNEYVKNGKIEPEKIAIKTEVTDSVKNLISITKEQIKKAFEVLSLQDMPDISLRYVNQIGVRGVRWFDDWMTIYKSLNSDLNMESIYFLSFSNADQIGKLEDAGITKISDIPKELCLRPKQWGQIQTSKTNKRIVDKKKIKEFLSCFEFPLYFFDYETFSSVIPKFDGCKPYKDYPFQYSLHVLDAPNSKIRHEEYLHAENSNPMPNLLKKLKTDIGNKGTVLTWNMSYEKGCNDRMGNFYPEYKVFLEDLNMRIKDLMIPFSKMWFVDKDFLGSASVKYVLPALVPELSYHDLEIADGLRARRDWMATILNGKDLEKKKEILLNLSKYCALDTYAMVKIWKKLRKIINFSD